jgi:hypothetical protein
LSAVGDAFNSPEQRNAIKAMGQYSITTSELSLINGAKLLANTLAQGMQAQLKYSCY